MVGRTGSQVPQVGPAGWEVTTTCHMTLLLFALRILWKCPSGCDGQPLPPRPLRGSELLTSRGCTLGPEKPFQSKTGPFPNDCPLLAPGLSASSSIMRDSSEDQGPSKQFAPLEHQQPENDKAPAGRDTCRVGSRQPHTPSPPRGLVTRAAMR